MPDTKATVTLERHLLNVMFNQSLFSDLALVFLHPSFPISMRFDVHKAILCQTPFFHHLLRNIDRIPTKGQPSVQQSGCVTTLTIDLVQAFSHRGFVLAPFQHIMRRKWQKPITAVPTPNTRAAKPTEQPSHLLASHIRFVLRWLYCVDKETMVQEIGSEDTLRILSVAVLFEIEDLAQTCVDMYTANQLSITTIMRDLEHICQLPRSHAAYLQLRDATLLLLLRCGPKHADSLALLPVDYMSDVLSADLLYVRCEFERYCLLRAVLMAFMQSVGKITWTPSGPIDQDNKRLSGFVRPMQQKDPKFSRFQGASSNNEVQSLTAETVRSRKRKRIPSEELEDSEESLSRAHERSRPRLSRLSFSACVPFEKLVADASSGGVIDKATVLSYLLRTTVIYSNMTFDQLTTVRQDGIVDESIVFRALWQREALERLMFPRHFQLSQSEDDGHEANNTNNNESEGATEERNAALDEYFDVDQSDHQERRRRLLLGTPRFRFRASVHITAPSVENEWEIMKPVVSPVTANKDTAKGSVSPTATVHEIDSNVSEDEEEASSSQIQLLAVGSQETSASTTNKNEMIYRKMFYSSVETVLGTPYRIQVEAQVLPRRLLHISDDARDAVDAATGEKRVLVCRFELQRDMRVIAQEKMSEVKQEKPEQGLASLSVQEQSSKKKSESTVLRKQKSITIPKELPDTTVHSQRSVHSNTHASTSSSQNSHSRRGVSSQLAKQTKVRYAIYCLNQHEGLVENNRIDPEDRVMVPVTEQAEHNHDETSETEPFSGYVSQIMVNSHRLDEGINIDAMVALEVFDFKRV